MISKRLHIHQDYLDITVKIYYYLADWSKIMMFGLTGLQEPAWYTQFDSHKEAAIIDRNAPIWYAELAALGEHLYAFPNFGDLCHDIRKDEHRSADVDRFIASIAGEKREAYIEARLTTYRDIVNNNAYFQRNAKDVNCAIAELEPLLDI